MKLDSGGYCSAVFAILLTFISIDSGNCQVAVKKGVEKTQASPSGRLVEALTQPIQVRIVDDQPWWRRSEVFSACAVLISLLALGVSLSQLQKQHRSVQLQTFEGVFQDVRKTEM